MFSPVAWSVVTTALLALASTALPPPLSDGSIIPRSYKTKMSWQDRLLAKKEEASNIKYIDCLEEWAASHSPLVKGNREKPTRSRKGISYKSAEQQCRDWAFIAWEVRPTKISKEEFDSMLKQGTLSTAREKFKPPKKVERPAVSNRGGRNGVVNNEDEPARSDKGGGNQNANPITLAGLQDIFKSVGSYFRKYPQRLGPGLGTPPWRPVPVMLN